LLLTYYCYVIIRLQIEASDVDFWGGNTQQMKLKHKTRAYPPSITVHVYSEVPGSHRDEITFEVSGVEDEPYTITVVKSFTVG
jgi:hypothetical protein